MQMCPLTIIMTSKNKILVSHASEISYSQEGSTFSNCFQESDYTGYNASLCKSGFYCLDPTVSTFCFLYKEQTQCIEKDIKKYTLNDNSFFGTGTTNQKSFETLLAAMNTCNKNYSCKSINYSKENQKYYLYLSNHNEGTATQNNEYASYKKDNSSGSMDTCPLGYTSTKIQTE